MEVNSTTRAETPSSMHEDDEPRIEETPVLQAGRVFLGILIENDRLPVDMQMKPQDIDRARDLLLGYFIGPEDVEPRARAMLETVETKFSQGLYSQAAILLELFESDQETRIENDRNLFYDEMILRFGDHQGRAGPLEDQTFETKLEAARSRDSEANELFDWLAETSGLSFEILARDLERIEHWRELASRSSREGAVDDLTSVLPPERWRRPSTFERPLIEIVEAYLSPERVQTYVLEHVKTCYFVLRAMGDTGLEPYLDVFFDWVEETFDVNGVALMPPLYEEMTSNERLLESVFTDLYDLHFAESAHAIRREWDRGDFEAGLDHFYDILASTDLEELQPGHYNLGHFVLDDLFEVEYHTDDFAFDMHRLV